MSRRPVGQLRQVIELEYEPGNLVYEWADVDLTEFPHLIVDHGRWLAEGETLEFQRRELVQTFVSLLELPPERFWQQLIETSALMAKSTPRQMTHVQLLPLFQDMELATRTAAQVPAIRALATAELIAANASGTSDNAEIAVAVLAKQADLKSIPALVDSQLFGNVDRIPFSDSGASAAIRTVRDPAIIDLLATRFDEFDEFTQADIAIAIGATQCVEAEKALLGLIKGIQPDDIRYECIAKGLRWLSFASDETQEVLLTAALTQEGLEDEEDLAEQVATLSLILGWTDPRAAELRERVGTEEDRDRQLLEQWNPFGDFADALAPSERPQPILSPTPNAKSEPKAGRNDPCPCGSGKKYKKCCLK